MRVLAWARLVTTLAAIGWLWTSALAKDEPAPKPARVTVRASPAISFAPTTVGLSVRVVDENRELSCPGFVVEWGDDCLSAIQPLDCDPYALEKDRPTEWSLPPLRHRYHLAGTFVVAVRVTSGSDIVRRGSARVMVLGREGLEARR